MAILSTIMLIVAMVTGYIYDTTKDYFWVYIFIASLYMASVISILTPIAVKKCTGSRIHGNDADKEDEV